jgi:hypothetical protein
MLRIVSLFLLIASVSLSTVAQRRVLTDDFVRNGVYSNNYFGFSFRYPRNWLLQNRNLARRIRAERPDAKTYPLLTVSKYPFGKPGIRSNPMVMIFAENISNTGITDGFDYWQVNRPTLERIGATFKTERPIEVLIAGRQFYRQDVILDLRIAVVHQAAFLTISRGYVLAFAFQSDDEQQLKQIIKSMDTLSFGGR